MKEKSITITDWLRDSAATLRKIGIGSGRLDAEIILAHTLRKSRTYLHAHLDDTLSIHAQEIADARLDLRVDRTPIAYIIGHKEFYGRNFHVSPSTLIPRPESEDIITILKEIVHKRYGILSSDQPRLVDVGTGSGCLGITAKCELRELDVTLLDTSRYAIQVAKKNSKILGVQTSIYHSNLLTGYLGQADYIIANLPYVDPSWQRSPETNHEPAEALFANDEGLYLIYKLLGQTTKSLAKNGFILLEADPRQHRSIVDKARHYNLVQREIRGFIVALQRSDD